MIIGILVCAIVIAFCVGWSHGRDDQAIFTDYWYGQSCFYCALLLGPNDDDGLEFDGAVEESVQPLKVMVKRAGVRV